MYSRQKTVAWSDQLIPGLAISREVFTLLLASVKAGEEANHHRLSETML